MDVQLKVLVGGNAGTTVKVVGPRFYVGRSAECHLRPKSDAIGRLHCVVALYDDYVTVCDLHSRNGTYVNGQRVARETRLKSGDHLKIGPLEFEVVIKDETSTGRHVGTAKISLDETDAGEAAGTGQSAQVSDPQNKSATDKSAAAKPDEDPSEPANTEEAAADVLRRLRRFRRG